MSYRDAVLEGTVSAQRLHDQLSLRDAVLAGGGRIDVFGSVLKLKATLQFAGLEGILGAFIKPENRPGILVTSRRPLSIQRFTGAHELGHYFMGHEPNIDGEEILASCHATSDVENQANAFAAEFISPRWLLDAHAKRQNWGYASVRDPVAVYQLSLRMGMSYEATCRSLQTHKILTREEAQRLHSVQPKTIKQMLVSEYAPEYEPDNWFPDVWLLSEKDQGCIIEGGPDDLCIFRLKERSGAGYLWDMKSLEKEGFAIIADRRAQLADAAPVGGLITRQAAARRRLPGNGVLNISHSRPWLNDVSFDHLAISYELIGREKGMPRAQRKNLALFAA